MMAILFVLASATGVGRVKGGAMRPAVGHGAGVVGDRGGLNVVGGEVGGESVGDGRGDGLSSGEGEGRVRVGGRERRGIGDCVGAMETGRTGCGEKAAVIVCGAEMSFEIQDGEVGGRFGTPVFAGEVEEAGGENDVVPHSH